MSVRGFLFATVVAAGCALMAPSFARAQGQFDPAQFRERMMNNVKERLGASDDEWKVLEPKVEKVMTAQRDARGGGFGGFGGGRRGGGNADQQPTTETGKASQELRTALENKDTPADEIAKKLAAFREARDKGRAQLQAAQKELKEILTQRQEAVLVNMGMLE
jgi:multidrug efflux pump subunit AcrB